MNWGWKKHGHKWLLPNPIYRYGAPDGVARAFWRDLLRTCAESAHYSKRDAENYAVLTVIMPDVCIVASP